MNTRTLTTAALLLLALAAVPAPAQAASTGGLDDTVNVSVCPDGQRLRIVAFLGDADPDASLFYLSIPQCEDAEDGGGEPCTNQEWWKDTKCDVNGCDFDSGDSSDYCHEVYCTHNPEAYTCQHNRECSNGFIDRDSDGDTYCDYEDTDDDNDGVPDESDPTPTTNDPFWNVVSCVSYLITDQLVCEPQ